MIAFNQHLSRIIESKKSHLCVGLDINPESLQSGGASLNELKHHTEKVITATWDLAAAYKPNLAFFERWGSAGFQWLEETMELFGEEVIIIGDAKRGDIGNTAIQYSRSLFEHFGFDAVTVAPYMGSDSITPFLDDPEKGAFILCRTSNPSAPDLQNLVAEGKTIFEKTAELAASLNNNNNVGLVVGATAPEEILRIRTRAKGLPFLIPGVGAQGGDLGKSLKDGNRDGIALINISRGISFAGDLSESAIREAAMDYVVQMQELINES